MKWIATESISLRRSTVTVEAIMGKSTKTQHLREKMRKAAKQTKQTTLDNLQSLPKKDSDKPEAKQQPKQIEITDVSNTKCENELVLRVGFKLVPSRTAFSRVTAEMFFDDQKIDSLRLRILQGPLATTESEFSSALDMTGIEAGQHKLKVEMYELWSMEEKLTKTSKEVTIEYIPVKREDRLVKVPVVKSVAGTDLAIVSDTQKNIYREIEADMKKQTISRRDQW